MNTEIPEPAKHSQARTPDGLRYVIYNTALGIFLGTYEKGSDNPDEADKLLSVWSIRDKERAMNKGYVGAPSFGSNKEAKAALKDVTDLPDKWFFAEVKSDLIDHRVSKEALANRLLPVW